MGQLVFARLVCVCVCFVKMGQFVFYLSCCPSAGCVRTHLGDRTDVRLHFNVMAVKQEMRLVFPVISKDAVVKA